ncbi:MAG: hypothetical protein QN131_10455 [Armatimonadota bacterium]|nr:hypothetical protein [Armatimonadota bacterium]
MLRSIRQFLTRQSGGRAAGPEVILDVLFDDGLLFLAVQNIGTLPAFNVSIVFDQPIYGLEGAREVSALPLFRHIAFLAPGREIRTFLDTAASYFQRRQPTAITAKVVFQDGDGRYATRIIRHDLEIYREIGYVRRASD